MNDISLAAVPNQDLFVQLEERAYQITLHAAGSDAVCITVVRDGETIISGQRLVTGTPVLPYRYMESGNFILTTDAEALPDWQQFGITQFLTYVTADELVALRA